MNETADIEASLRQEETLAGVKLHELKGLDWPITLRMDGPGLGWTEHEIPIKVDWVTFFGTAISGLAALMVGVFGSGWDTALLKTTRRRTSHP